MLLTERTHEASPQEASDVALCQPPVVSVHRASHEWRFLFIWAQESRVAHYYYYYYLLIYLHLMILKVTMHSRKRKKINCTYFAEPMSHINIYTIHISYIRSFLFHIFSVWGFQLLLLLLLEIVKGLGFLEHSWLLKEQFIPNQNQVSSRL